MASLAGELSLSLATLIIGAGAEFSPPSPPTSPHELKHSSSRLKSLMMTYWITKFATEMKIGFSVARCRRYSIVKNLRKPKICKFDASAPRKR